MAFENVASIWQRPRTFLIWLVTTLLIGWLYIGPLTDQEAYGPAGWVFALLFPVLVAATVAVQVANYQQARACPVQAVGGGIGGSLFGIFTVGCASCPAILAGWIGLGSAIPSSLLASPWLKLGSLFLLFLSLYWSSSAKRASARTEALARPREKGHSEEKKKVTIYSSPG
jgi:hypothetical protein